MKYTFGGPFLHENGLHKDTFVSEVTEMIPRSGRQIGPPKVYFNFVHGSDFVAWTETNSRDPPLNPFQPPSTTAGAVVSEMVALCQA